MTWSWLSFAVGILLCFLIVYLFRPFDCRKEPPTQQDTLYVKGKDSLMYKDRFYTIYKESPAEHILDTIKTSLDTVFVSFKDTLEIHAEVSIIDSTGTWGINLTHKDASIIRVDTLYLPKMIEVKPPGTVFDDIKYISFFILIGEILALISYLIF